MFAHDPLSDLEVVIVIAGAQMLVGLSDWNGAS